MAKFQCSINECAEEAHARGWCRKHYKRWRRHGHPTSGGVTPGTLRSYYEKVVLPYSGDECLLWPFGRSSFGYALMLGGTVHRMVCTDINGRPPTEKHYAAHRCGNGALGCVAGPHLYWATPKQNAADKLRHDTHNRGERHYRAKLKRSEVLKIAQDKTMRPSDMARQYGVSPQLICDIQKGRRWRWALETKAFAGG